MTVAEEAGPVGNAEITLDKPSKGRPEGEYWVGELISGTLVIDQTEDFQAEELRIGLFGSEFTSFLTDPKDKTSAASGMYTFLNTEICLQKYIKGKTETGRSEYKFEFRLPDWLPATVQF